MGTVPVFPTFTPGETPTAAKLNLMRAWADFKDNPPQISAFPTGTQNLTTSVWAVIALDGEVFDIVQSGDTLAHDLVTNNSRLYCRTTGKYEITGQVQIASSAAGLRAAQVRLNAAGNVAGGTLISSNQQGPVSGGSTSVSITPPVLPLTAGDYIELFGFQSSGGTVATVGGSAFTFLRLKYVSA